MADTSFDQFVEYKTQAGIFPVAPEQHTLDSAQTLSAVADGYEHAAQLGRAHTLDVSAFVIQAAPVFHADVLSNEVVEDAAETFTSLAWVMSWPEWSLIPVGAQIAANSYVRHDKRLWQVKLTHNKQADWTPLVAVSLFWPWYDPSVIPAWVQPAGSHDVYPLNYRVTHNGKTWRSLVADNVWQPGAVGSEALWLDESLPPVGAWSGAGVAYKVNDLVTYNGSTYKCLQAHVSQPGWSPTAVPALWQLQA